MVVPAGYCCAVVEPSPHTTDTVSGSVEPAPPITPLSVVELPSLMLFGVNASCAIDGATAFTTTEVVPVPVPPSLSVAVTTTGSVAVALPAGVAANVCVATNARVAGSTVAGEFVPSPQFTTAVSPSRMPGSVIVPVSVTPCPTLTVPALSTRPETAGGTLSTTTAVAAEPVSPTSSVAVATIGKDPPFG